MRRPYDFLARFYDAAFAPLERYYLKRQRRDLLRLIEPNSRLLEIGAGTGANFEFYPSDCVAAAIEISFPMLERAKLRSDPPGLVQADAQFLPFPADHFDAAFATLVFCSVPDARTGLEEALRVLKPGGRLLLLEHVRPNGFKGPLFDALSVLTVALIDDHFDRRTSEVVREVGFEVADIETMVGGAVVRIHAVKPKH